MESMTIMSTVPTVEKQGDGAKGRTEMSEEDEGLDVNDDFKREMHLYAH